MTDNPQNGNPTVSNPDDIYDAPVTVQEGQVPPETEGTRLENFISPRTFVAMAEILPMLAGLPIGQSVPLGHIGGMVRGYEKRESQLPLKSGDKAPPPSIWLRGEFEATSYQTGEITRSVWAILPRVMGELVAEALDNHEGEAILDIELGVAATGRAIPYTYTVTTYSATRAQTALTAIRMRQQKRLEAKRKQDVEAGKKLIEGGGNVKAALATSRSAVRKSK